MSTETTHPSLELRPTPRIYIEKLLPDNFDSVGEDGLWNCVEIRDGEWHGQDHVIMVLGLVNDLSGVVEQRLPQSVTIDPVVQNLNAIYHDTKRKDDGVDIEHAQRAASTIELLKGKLLRFADKTIDTAAFICHHHNMPINDVLINDKLKSNWNLRFFLFCDVLAMVRYENGQDGFEITPELLEKILPHTFSCNELKFLLDRTRTWHKTAKEISEHNSAISKKQAMLEAGQRTNFFS